MNSEASIPMHIENYQYTLKNCSVHQMIQRGDTKRTVPTSTIINTSVQHTKDEFYKR